MGESKKEELGGVQLWAGGPFWAECNLGVTKPEEYGHYFMWGDTVGYKHNVDDDVWVSDNDGTMIRFDHEHCQTYDKDYTNLFEAGIVDKTGKLVADHDAATAYLGSPWRIPTMDEMEALVSNCDTVWMMTRNGVNGRLVTGRGAFSAKHIFFPDAGFGGGDELYDTDGGYWSSTPISGCSLGAWRLGFDSGYFGCGSGCRYNGHSIRPVR